MKAISMTATVVMAMTIFLAPLAQAATTIGNGGDAVVCRDSSGILSARLLDFYEAEIREIPINVGSPSNNFEENLNLALNVLAGRDPRRAEHYRGWSQTFMQESRFLSGTDLTDIPDSSHIAVPKNCQIEQVVIQNTPVYPEDRRYTFSKDIWDKMDSVHQAGLILHELLYREGIANKLENSMPTRYLNSMIWSQKLLTMNFKPLFELYLQNRFETMNYMGLQVEQIRVGSDSVQATLQDKGAIDFQGQRIDLVPESTVTWYLDGALGSFRPANNVELKNEFYHLKLKAGLDHLFHPNGIYKKSEGATSQLPCCLKGETFFRLQGVWQNVPEAGLTVYDNGHVEGFDLEDGDTHELLIQGQKIPVLRRVHFFPSGNVDHTRLTRSTKLKSGPNEFWAAPNRYISFHENGDVMHCLLLEETKLFNAHGEHKTYPANRWVTFNEKGELTSATQDN